MPGNFYLANHNPEFCGDDIACTTKPDKLHKCYKKGKQVKLPEDNDDCYIAGFVCKPYSLENCNRHTHQSLESLFDENGIEGHNVTTLFACTRTIRRRKKKNFVLENTKGCTINISGLNKAS